MSGVDTLPLFPLKLVLFPGEELPLHIFEPRYKAMTNVCLDEERPFGIVQMFEGRMARVGSTAAIAKVLQVHNDGRMDIVVEGGDRFRVVKVSDEKPYLVGHIEPYEIAEAQEQPTPKQVNRLIALHQRLLERAGRPQRSLIYEQASVLSFSLAHNVGLEPEQKQRLLEMPGELERVAFLTEHIEYLLGEIERVESFRRKVQSNGHFRDFPPRLPSQ
ncbi:MAG: LON peptidase substrate-binding domain-containing protein [Rhodothermales bacterium]